VVRTLVAFASSAGSVLLVGVEDRSSERVEFPVVALREAITSAIVHNDYGQRDASLGNPRSGRLGSLRHERVGLKNGVYTSRAWFTHTVG
jgi:predicted HTH transcriptional regulator